MRLLEAQKETQIRRHAREGKIEPSPVVPLPVNPPRVPQELEEQVVGAQGPPQGPVVLFSHKPKWIGFSKSFLGIVLSVAGLLGKDVAFGKDIVANWDLILTAVGNLVTLWGIVTRKGPVTLWPTKAHSSSPASS
jgi:hypothetical protein